MKRAIEDCVPPHIIAAFEGHAALTVPKVARLLEMDRKTVRHLIGSRRLTVHPKGGGNVRQHYVCTIHDVADYFREEANHAPRKKRRGRSRSS
jgi:hypothetical protein